MKHKVKHLHFIADDARTDFGPRSGRSRLLAQTPTNADEAA